jgi:hypothetical protein
MGELDREGCVRGALAEALGTVVVAIYDYCFVPLTWREAASQGVFEDFRIKVPSPLS